MNGEEGRHFGCFKVYTKGKRSTFVRFILVQMSVCVLCVCVQNCGNLMNERHHSIVVFLYCFNNKKKERTAKNGNVYRLFLKFFFCAFSAPQIDERVCVREREEKQSFLRFNSCSFWCVLKMKSFRLI